MMSLNGLRRATHRARLDDVRIKSTLHQPVDSAFRVFAPMGLFVEDGDELIPDDLALGFRIGDAFQLGKKTFGCIDRLEMQAQVVTQVLLNFFEFVLAQDAVIHEDAGQARGSLFVPQSAIDQCGGNCGINSAGESADGSSLAYGLANGRNRLVNEALRGPIRLGPANVEYE